MTEEEIKGEVVREVGVFINQVGAGFREQTLWRAHGLFKQLLDETQSSIAGQEFYKLWEAAIDNPQVKQFDSELLNKAKALAG